MNKYILLWLSLFFSQILSAQSLNVNGSLVIDNAGSEGARIVVLRNNIELERREIGKKGRFDLKFGLGADYRIFFEKDGYVTKIVNINTDVPDEIIQSNPDFPPVKLIVTLLPQVEGVDLSIFEQPIANLSYNYELDDFTFDKEYSSKIKDRIARTEQEIRKMLAKKGSEALAREQLFAELTGKGERAFSQRHWQEAVGHWNKALQLKPDKKELEEKIAIAQKEYEREEAEKSVAAQNARIYKTLVASGDSLFAVENYDAAESLYREALALNYEKEYPEKQLNAIAAIRKKASDKQKQEEELRKQQEEAALKQQEELRRAELMNRYNRLIETADAAFKTENYAIARAHYVEADQLQTGESYPKNKIKEIDNIFNSGKYKQRLAEFNHNKELAEQALEEKNYAGAKVYYEKAASILPIDKEEIQKKIAEVDKLIEAERLALQNKEYQSQIEKAEQAYKEKSYAIAKFYYQKALEIKKDDKYAKEKLNEVEELINERTEKTMEL